RRRHTRSDRDWSSDVCSSDLFVSEGRRNWLRDYETKRDEYETCGVLEYWVFDRFDRTLTVYKRHGNKFRKRVYRETSVYTTDLRSEEHTSELQSRSDLVCRLL